MIRGTLFIVLLMFVSDIFAQNKFANEMLPQQAQMSDYQALMEAWTHQDPLQNKKGWKWMARWIFDQQKNLGHDGLPPLTTDVYDGFAQFDQFKKGDPSALATRQNNAQWSPAGPMSAPVPTDSFLIPGSGRINCITFHPTDSNTMWCGGGQGGIFKSTNRGASWFPIGDQLPVMHVSDIAVDPGDPDIMYVSVGDYAYVATGLFLDNRKRHTHYGLGVYKTINGGATWNPTGLAFEQSQEDASLTRRVMIDPDNTNRLCAAGIQGIWTSENGGDTWTKKYDEIIWDMERNMLEPQTIYASTGFLRTLNQGKASMIKSTDFGNTWTTLPQLFPEKDSVARIEIAIAQDDPNLVYIISTNLFGGMAGIYRTTDGGDTWDLRTSGPNILTWFDAGGISGQGWYDLAILVDPSDTDRLYVGGVNSWVSDDGGSTWNGASHYWGYYGGVSVHADHHMLTYNAYDAKIYLCHDGGVSRTTRIEKGDWFQVYSDTSYRWPTIWEHLDNGLANLSFYRLGVSQTEPGNIYSGAQDMGTFLRQNGSWTYHTLGDGMECLIDSRNDSIMIGSSQFGNLFRSTNKGNSFESLAGNPWGQNGQSPGWTTPFYQLDNDPQTLIVGGSQVFLSIDDGVSFNQISNFSNEFPISALSYCEDDSKTMHVAKRLYNLGQSPSSVHVTFDQGLNWADITSGLPEFLYFSYLDTDNDDPLHTWITCAGFDAQNKVFETFDGGQTWSNITYNLPNLPANCMLHQKGSVDDIVYVGMDRGVYFKRANEVNWTLYSEGLPNVVVTELEIQRATEKLYISTFGRGIWMNDIIQDLQVSTDHFSKENIKGFVSPNPSAGVFNINIESEKAGKLYIDIIDVMGRKVYDTSTNLNVGQNSIPVQLDVLSGVYYVRLHAGKTMQVFNVLIN